MSSVPVQPAVCVCYEQCPSAASCVCVCYEQCPSAASCVCVCAMSSVPVQPAVVLADIFSTFRLCKPTYVP